MSKTSRKKSTICLNMIVKNEAHIVRRCLESVKPYIDTWVISDTGSTDGTQDLIREIMHDVPGELIEREWKDFGHNRDEVLQYASDKADYSLIIDADEWLEADEGFDFSNLEFDCYYILKDQGSNKYWVQNIVKNNSGWRWEGVLHEHLKTEKQHYYGEIENAVIQARQEGARSLDPETYRKDAAILERALADEPENTRYQFYLAQSYRDADEMALAKTHYKRRSEMGGWHEEVFYSLYQTALAMEELNEDWSDCLSAYLTAWEHTPERAEPLFQIGATYYDNENYALAKLFLAQAANLEAPKDLVLFINSDIYLYLAAFYAGAASAILEDYEDAIHFYGQVIKNAPEDSEHYKNAHLNILDCKKLLNDKIKSAA